MTDSVQSIQIAPDGVVTDIYPQEGNDAGKIDLLMIKIVVKYAVMEEIIKLLQCRDHFN